MPKAGQEPTGGPGLTPVQARLSSDESDSEGTASTFGHMEVVRGSSSNEFSETDRSSQGAFGRRRKTGSDIIDC